MGEEIATGKTYIVCITVKSTQYLAFDFLSPEQCSWINFGSQQSGYCFYFPVRPVNSSSNFMYLNNRPSYLNRVSP